MSSKKKIYWKGLPELKNDAAFVKHADKEFVDLGVQEDPGHSRRDFLKMMGFSVAAASLAACEAPVRKAIPYIVKPVDVDPGIPNYYASTYVNGGDYCSVVVKVRDGRPIKLEGNALSSVTKGGTSAQVEASVLSLYDNFRLRGPKIADKASDWETVDKEITTKLGEIAGKGGQIRIVSNTLLSPSTKAAIEVFKAKYPTTTHIQYDPVSYYGMWKANEESFGKGLIPSYDFSKAKLIVSVGADFLGTWLSPIEFTKGYAVNREVSEDKREMSRHYQFESNLTLTGANADYRGQMKPSQEGAVLAQIYNIVTGGSATDSGVKWVEKAAKELLENKGASLVVCSSNDKETQVLVNEINNALGNYGTTILPGLPVNFRQGNDEAMAAFVEEVKGGKVDGVIFYNCNPVYDHPMGADLEKALKSLTLSVSTSYTPDETASASGYMAPDHHYLESWNDFEPKPGHYSLSQPAITPLFKSRQAQESFMVWVGEQNVDYFTFVSDNWKKWFFDKQNAEASFQTFWDKCLYNGVYEFTADSTSLNFTSHAAEALSVVTAAAKPSGQYEVVIYESYGIGTGAMANNPLLQELPDPITKATWDHYVTVSQLDAKDLGIENDAEGHTQMLSFAVNGKQVELPALIQPGQAKGTLGVALGYGRTKVGAVAENLGQNLYPALKLANGSLSYIASVAKPAVKDSFQLAQTQIHQTYMGRENVIQESVLAEFKKDPSAGRWNLHVSNWDKKEEAKDISLWKGHEYKNHYWGMAIDLNTCTGCAACVVACNVENNVALVGKQEVINRREMHWLRIDRYYSSDALPGSYKEMEIASDNPEVTFQPMMCQHCNNAPCETVCPVAATTHSTEGLNQMTYNRCIGTRYCANNCPYKVRRFNWFKYHDNQQFYSVNPAMNTDLGRMVLNPEVTVRSRGVMEKCSFCVQRIQTGKLTAKKEKRPLNDGEVITACQAACTTGAIVFGDMNNPESRISKLLKIENDPKRPYSIDKKIGNPRAYRVLEDIGVKPNVFYLTKIRNKDVEKSAKAEQKEHA
ncbi:MAG: TAT-variant-translocated molybdopterin oxidoreductase [Bacteroidota bacterium]|jgi:MoCo/4Fe-4S cofactor protein with predicted Tat translocation signal|nr:TAT-variant-translocated molybdopterin oxidoreductase [Cytophagales bacterium]